MEVMSGCVGRLTVGCWEIVLSALELYGCVG